MAKRTISSSRPADHPAGPPSPPGPRWARDRVRAFGAGRRFRRLVLYYRHLALGPHPAHLRALGRLAVAVTARLDPMIPSSAGPVAAEVEQQITELFRGLGSGRHSDDLEAAEVYVAHLVGPDAAEFDLHGYRESFRRRATEQLEIVGGRLAGALPEPLAAAFRLGDVVEAGRYPVDPGLPYSGEVEPREPTPADFTAGVVLEPAQAGGFGGRGRHGHLVLAEEMPEAGGRPWPVSWPGEVRKRWVATGLPVNSLPGIPDGLRQPDRTADRNRALRALVSTALRCLADPRTASRKRLEVYESTRELVYTDGNKTIRGLVNHQDVFKLISLGIRAGGFSKADRVRCKRVNAKRSDRQLRDFLPEELFDLLFEGRKDKKVGGYDYIGPRAEFHP